MSDHARSIVLVFDESHTRIQTVSELLLISCIPRPVFTRAEDLNLTKDNFVRYRDRVIGQLNRMLILSRDIATQVHAKQIQWKPFCHRTQELTTAVIHLSELSAHIAYLIAANTTGSQPAVLGPVANIHQLTQADLDIRFSCTRLKRSRMSDLQPHLLVDLCSVLTKSLTAMTDICRQAADKISDSNDQDQFKLCVKAITSTTGCLVSSIKSFKHQPSETHFRRVVTFCDPVISTSGALLNFASEGSFVGIPAVLSAEGLEAYKSILGLCMSIASANIQICRAVRDLVYSYSTKRQQDRMSLCVESITRSSSQLRDLLLSHEFTPKSGTDLCGRADSDSTLQTRTSEKFDMSSGVSEPSPSQEAGRMTSPSAQTLRSSAEKEMKTINDNKVSQLGGGDPHSSDTAKHTQEECHRHVTQAFFSSPLSSRPVSMAGESSETSSRSGISVDGDLKSVSPQHFLSSPLSISSSSLTASFSDDQDLLDSSLLTELEKKETVSAFNS
ncbi:unnamed protein product [Candidula unifasciata]|uniref:Talin IBS2B domain-containing protein n=1 Tax=Candidula unifasciata TaxID=100452 RepID=A0A8S3ZV36_9EUPU|nr:unnamed protein product [Candidula unifasciata]